MNHSDHVFLIKKAINEGKSTWADFGSGWGAFTLALRDIAGEDIEIYSIDKDIYSLKEQKANFNRMFPKTNIHYLEKDFTVNLDLPLLDGILMANSLHYIKGKVSFLKKIKTYLKPNGKLVIVEYDSDKSNSWLPYPISFKTFSELARDAEFINQKLLETMHLEWINMYSAEAYIK